VTVSTAGTISASYGGAIRIATLTVIPTVRLSALTLSPTTVTGSAFSTGTVTLDGPAPAGGAAVALSSNNTAATVPGSVMVPGGATSATFAVSTKAVATSTSVTVSASYSGTTQTAILTVIPPVLTSLAMRPPAVTGGTSSIGTVMLDGPAPAGGAQVVLSSDNPAVATAPDLVTVPAGARSATFAVATHAVGATTAVTISASYGGSSRAASLTVLAPVLSSLTLSPTTVTGGLENSTGTVTLNGPAPPGGAQVALSSSNPSVASVPSSVMVPAGATSATFTVTTSIVVLSQNVTISGFYNGSSRSATLTVRLLPLL
jgi:hypothetical protein